MASTQTTLWDTEVRALKDAGYSSTPSPSPKTAQLSQSISCLKACLCYWSTSLWSLERGNRAQSYWSTSLCSPDRSSRAQSCVNGGADGLLEEAPGVDLSSINSMMSTVMSVSTLSSSGGPSSSCTPTKSPVSSKPGASKSPTISRTARKNPVGPLNT